MSDPFFPPPCGAVHNRCGVPSRPPFFPHLPAERYTDAAGCGGDCMCACLVPFIYSRLPICLSACLSTCLYACLSCSQFMSIRSNCLLKWNIVACSLDIVARGNVVGGFYYCIGRRLRSPLRLRVVSPASDRNDVPLRKSGHPRNFRW